VWSKIVKDKLLSIDFLKTGQSKVGDEWIEPNIGMVFMWVPPNIFQMGNVYGDEDEDTQPVHYVELDGFWLGKYPVTQGEWEAVMGKDNSSREKRFRHPIDEVSWDNCQLYIKRLNLLGGGRYHLPSEAQWEFAARSGGKKERYAGGDNLDLLGWFSGNSGSSAPPVGLKAPNGLGLHDMSGNVWEWCQDAYSKDAYGQHKVLNPIYNPCKPTIYDQAHHTRVLRGGNWFSHARVARCAFRYKHAQYYNVGGFRIAKLP
jgi:formylglycine-generating enzyme required for sulfatase activity